MNGGDSMDGGDSAAQPAGYSAGGFSAATSRREQPRGSAASRMVISIGLVLVGLLLSSVASCYVLTVVIPREAGRGAIDVVGEGADRFAGLVGRLADELGFTPRMTVDSEVYAQGSQDVLELATVQRDFRIEYTLQEAWLGSVKEIELTATYRARAGFNLAEQMAIDIETRPGEAPRFRIQVGEPTLLSLEQLSVEVDETGGLWNRISDADRNLALAGLRQQARRQALASDLLEEAQRALERRLQGAILDQVAPTEFQFGDPELPAAERGDGG